MDRLNYVGSQKEFREFCNHVSDNTGKHFHDLWESNLEINRDLPTKHGWAAGDLQDVESGKTAVLLGGSPSIKSQIGRLQRLQHDKDFVLIGISSNIKWLLENGIRPKYCFVADASPDISFHFDGLGDVSDITLIANILTHPDTLSKWNGPKKMLGIYTAIEDLDKKIKDIYGTNLNGCGQYFFALMSQYNTATAFAFTVLRTKILIFVGNELSFETQNPETSAYYVDRKDHKDNWIRKPHINIYGGVSYTNYMLFSLKLALEDFLGKVDGWFFNATEAGIFGVSIHCEGYNLKWIHQLTLHYAVLQAKSLMATGQVVEEPKILEEGRK